MRDLLTVSLPPPTTLFFGLKSDVVYRKNFWFCFERGGPGGGLRPLEKWHVVFEKRMGSSFVEFLFVVVVAFYIFLNLFFYLNLIIENYLFIYLFND